MSNDFFNLNSDDEDEEEDKNSAIRKWDWDREENAHLYYGHSNEVKLVGQQFKKPKIENEPSLRPDQSNDLNSRGNSNLNAEKLVGPQFKKQKIEPGTSSHQLTFEESKRPIIERVQWDNKNSTSRLLYNLKGHSQTVNRINWKKGNETILLSSSMDR